MSSNYVLRVVNKDRMMSFNYLSRGVHEDR